MGEQANLRSVLSQTENSSSAIQNSAASMMKLYIISPALAVSEWRNALQSSRNSQLLPLLYVANEVIQSSKRNRGNKFLEQFSPVLKGSLQFICERDPEVVEKVRRVAKIWGDRRVFSVRFVADLLSGVEEFRNLNSKPLTKLSNEPDPRFSPLSNQEFSKPSQSNAREEEANEDNDIQSSTFHNSREDEDSISDADDDDSSPFMNSGPSLLNVDNLKIDHNEVIKTTATSNSLNLSRKPFGARRRKSDEASKLAAFGSKLTRGGSFGNKRKRNIRSLNSRSEKPPRRSALSTSSLVEIFEQISNLESQFRCIDGEIASLNTSSNGSDEEGKDSEIMEVGDELIELNQKVCSSIQTLKKQKTALYQIANEKKNLEREIQRHLPWLKMCLKVDEDEIKLCENVESKLQNLQIVHEDSQKARDKKRKRIAKEKALAEAAARKKEEEEELKRSLAKTIKKKDKADLGMVWNKNLMEYVHLPDATEESWRD